MPSNNFGHRGGRKKQMRLTFDPVDPSSSATLSPARVRYSVPSSNDNLADLSSPRRSPIRSSATCVMSHLEDSDIDLQSLRSSNHGKSSKPTSHSHQPSRLSYTSGSSDSDLDLPHRGTISFMKRPSQRQSASTDGVAHISGGASEDLQRMPHRNRPAKILKNQEGKGSEIKGKETCPKKIGKVSEGEATTTSALINIDDDDDDDDEIILPTPRRTQKSLNRSSTCDIGHETDDSGPLNRSSQRNRCIRNPITLENEEDSDEELNDEIVLGISTTMPALSRKRRRSTLADNPKEIESDSDALIIASPTKRLRQSEGEEAIDEEEQPLNSSPAKRRRKLESKENVHQEHSGPVKRGSGTKLSRSRRLTRQNQPKRAHRTAKQKTFELLKRKRAGENITELTASDTDEDEPKHGLYDSDSELVALSEFDDEESDGEQRMEEVRRSISVAHRDNYDDDFVVEDDNGPLGLPSSFGLKDIPLQFTSAAHRPLKEHFKIVVEWMVQRKINPAFSRDDPIYVHAFRKIDDEVRGYASSKFTSSAWKEGFTKALWARPEFYEQEIPVGDIGEIRSCGACGRSRHPAKYIIQFGGHTYNKDTLDEIGNGEDDSDDAEDSDLVSINSKGQVIPKQEETWYVGRFCKDNAETAHSLIHWKYALNSWVLDTIKNEGHLDPAKLSQREEWSKKKKNKCAISIVDVWESGKQIASLWKDFKNVLERARESKQSKYRTSRGN